MESPDRQEKASRYAAMVVAVLLVAYSPVKYPSPLGRVPPQFPLVTMLARLAASSTTAIFQPLPYVVAQMVWAAV